MGMTDKPLVCPECGTKVAWNGLEHCCLACPWTEFKAKPPSSSIIPAPEKPDTPKKDEGL